MLINIISSSYYYTKMHYILVQCNTLHFSALYFPIVYYTPLKTLVCFIADLHVSRKRPLCQVNNNISLTKKDLCVDEKKTFLSKFERTSGLFVNFI